MNNTLADKMFCKVNSEFREIFEDTTRKMRKEMVRRKKLSTLNLAVHSNR